MGGDSVVIIIIIKENYILQLFIGVIISLCILLFDIVVIGHTHAQRETHSKQ